MLKNIFLFAFVLIALSACANTKPVSTQTSKSNPYLELDKEIAPSTNETVVQNEQNEQTPGALKPVIMVYPFTDSLQREKKFIFSHEEFSNVARETVNEYLASKGYEVRSFEAASDLESVVELLNDILGTEDASYAASLILGADVYIKVSGTYENSMMNVELTAYETSTARVLASQVSHLKNNGYKRENLSFIVHDAVKKALVALEKKMLSTFTLDLEKGTPYKVILKIGENYEGSALDELQDAIPAALRNKFLNVYINGITERTVDAILYVNPQTYADAYQVYTEIKNALSSFTLVKKNSISKKLIVLELQ